jgi:hypothetical protein
MTPSPRKPFAGFRLNAPQAESQAENGSGEFAGLGDELTTGRGPFSHTHHRNDNNDDMDMDNMPIVLGGGGGSASSHPPTPPQPPHLLHDSPKSPLRRPSLTLEQHRQLLLQQQVEIQLRQQQEKQLQQQQQQLEQDPAFPMQPPPSHYKILIGIGLCIILLLIGLIITVLVVLGGEESARTLPQSSSSTTSPPTTDLRPTPSVTVAPSTLAANGDGPTLSPKTTLGRIVQRGTLLCGVGESQPGFSQVDLDSGERIGIDAELVRVPYCLFVGGGGRKESVCFPFFHFPTTSPHYFLWLVPSSLFLPFTTTARSGSVVPYPRLFLETMWDTWNL